MESLSLMVPRVRISKIGRALTLLAALGFTLAWGQGTSLKRDERLIGITAVTVLAEASLQNEVELRLRQAGMRVRSLVDEPLDWTVPTLNVFGIAGGTIASVELYESVHRDRDSRAFRVVMWQQYGVIQPPPSVADIVARYRPQLFQSTPAGRQILEHMMDLEVQAAIAKAQSPANTGTLRDVIKGFVDEFLNDWLAANPKVVH